VIVMDARHIIIHVQSERILMENFVGWDAVNYGLTFLKGTVGVLKWERVCTNTRRLAIMNCP
jgi:hypothetical protein